MKFLDSSFLAPMLCLSAMMASCDGNAAQATPGVAQLAKSFFVANGDHATSQSSRLFSASAAMARSDDALSWVDSSAKYQDLLYVSNVYTVTIYSFPRGKHLGTLRGFYRPVGECTDATGDVFIANANEVLEYAHAGKSPIHTLTLSGYTPEGCGVDLVTGDLAVTWYQSASSPNYVAVYKTPKATPKLYTTSNVSFVFCGYDGKGNLFADGYYGQMSSNFVLTELSRGANKLKPVALDQSFEHPGAVQWDGQYLAVGDDEAQKIYRFSISHLRGSSHGTVDLGNAQSVFQWWIEGKRLVGSDDLPSTVWYWNYPAGGPAIKSITKAVFHPYGATISRAKV